MRPGEVCNGLGDLFFGPDVPPLAAGKVAVTLKQAIKAAAYGWRMVAADSDNMGTDLRIWIQRGGECLMKRRGS